MSAPPDIAALVNRLRAITVFADCAVAADAIEALAKDAARYRWLRDNDCTYPYERHIVRLLNDVPHGFEPASFDCIIDAAIDRAHLAVAPTDPHASTATFRPAPLSEDVGQGEHGELSEILQWQCPRCNWKTFAPPTRVDAAIDRARGEP